MMSYARLVIGARRAKRPARGYVLARSSVLHEAAASGNRGRFAFRPWSFDLVAKEGKNTVSVNAINKLGQSQTSELIFNPAGYHNNVMQRITLNA